MNKLRRTLRKYSNRLWKPFIINIEISAMCNLNCTMCGFQHYYHPKGLMLLDTFMKLDAAFRRADVMTFGFNAEALLNPHIVEMIDIARKANPRLFLEIITNGSLLTGEISEQLVERTLSQLSISIDGATRETHEWIRQGSSFERLMAAIRELRRIKRSRRSRHPLLVTTFVGTRDNIHELPDFVDLARDLGIASIDFIMNSLRLFLLLPS